MTPEIQQFLDNYNWKGLAEMWQKSDMVWHADEWRDFIEKVRERSRTDTIQQVREKLFPNGTDDKNIDLSSYGWIISILDNLHQD